MDHPVYKQLASVDLFDILRRRWPLIAATTVVAMLLAGLYHFAAPKAYESRAEIMVMKKNPAMTSMNAGQTSDVQLNVMDDVLSTHMELVTSVRVINNAINNRGLDSLPGLQECLDEDTTLLKYIREQLRVSRGGLGEAKSAQVLNVGFVHSVPEEAQTVLGAVIESYQNLLGDTFQDVSTQAVTLIEKAKDDLEADLNQEEAAYAEFRGDSAMLFAGDNSIGLHERKLLELEAKRSELQLDQAMISSRLSLIKQSFEGASAANYSDRDRLALIDDQHVQRLGLLVNVERGNAISEEFQALQPARAEAANTEYERLLDLRAQEQALRSRFGNNHPKLAEIRSTIADMTNFLATKDPGGATGLDKLDPTAVIKAYVGLLENDLQDVENRLTDIQRMATTSLGDAKQQDVVEAKDQMLNDRLKRKRELYDAVVGRIREISMVGDYAGYITEVISPPSLAEQVWPSLIPLLALGSVVGMVVGSGWATASHMVDKTFETSDQIRDTLGAPILGQLPEFHAAKQIAEVNAHISPLLPTVHQPQSIEAEAIRGIRTSLFFTATGKETQVIQVTSATPSDGKSLVSSNLAVALANVKKRTLLIDADLRRPTQQVMLGARQTPGLSDVLIETCDLTDAIQATSVDSLDILTSGTIPPNPAELLMMPAFHELIETLRSKYDYVVIDSPPVLAVSDPLNSVKSTDGVILVVPVRKRHAMAVIRAKEALDSVEANLLGAVVNDQDNLLPKGTGKYGRYEYGYGYIDYSSNTEQVKQEKQLAGSAS